VHKLKGLSDLASEQRVEDCDIAVMFYDLDVTDL
jgi:hypothetical protein